MKTNELDLTKYEEKKSREILCILRFFPPAVVSQLYEADVNKEYAIVANSALIKCQVPSFMVDLLTVESWLIDSTTVIRTENYGT